MFYRCYFSFPSVIYLKDTYYNSQEVKLRFMNAMHSVAKVAGAAVAKAFDLSGYKTACDLGGEGTMHIRLLLCSLIFKHLPLLFSSKDALVPWPTSLLKLTLDCL